MSSIQPNLSNFDSRFIDLSILAQVKDSLVKLHDCFTELYNSVLKEKVKLNRLAATTNLLHNTVDDRNLCLQYFDRSGESLSVVINELRKAKKMKGIMNTADSCFTHSKLYFNSALLLHKEYCTKNTITAFSDPGFGSVVKLDVDEPLRPENNLDIEVYAVQVNHMNTNVNSFYDKISEVVNDCIKYRNEIALKYKQIMGNVMIKEGSALVQSSA